MDCYSEAESEMSFKSRCERVSTNPQKMQLKTATNALWYKWIVCTHLRWCGNDWNFFAQLFLFISSVFKEQSQTCVKNVILANRAVQDQNFIINPEKLAKVPGTREESSNHLHWQFLGTLQSFWTSLSWNHCTSRPHRSETNGIAERAVDKLN